MAPKERPKMPPAQRAKQFAPFAALVGFETALRRRREALELIPPPQLSEDQIALINQALAALSPGDPVTLSYYHLGRLATITDRIRSIDLSSSTLVLEAHTIPFQDLFRLMPEEKPEESPYESQ